MVCPLNLLRLVKSYRYLFFSIIAVYQQRQGTTPKVEPTRVNQPTSLERKVELFFFLWKRKGTNNPDLVNTQADRGTTKSRSR
jgi:hypothetical protein